MENLSEMIPRPIMSCKRTLIAWLGALEAWLEVLEAWLETIAFVMIFSANANTPNEGWLKVP